MVCKLARPYGVRYFKYAFNKIGRDPGIMPNKEEGILVVIEWSEDSDKAGAIDLVGAGLKLAESCRCVLRAVIIGSEFGNLPDELARYVHDVYLIGNEQAHDFQADAHAEALTRLCKQICPSIVLIKHDYTGMELAPKATFRLDGELVTDCISVEEEGHGHFICYKEIYGGNAVAAYNVKNTPLILTIRPSAHQPLTPGETSGEIIPLKYELDTSIAPVRLVSAVPEKKAGLDTADVIVAGGRGVNSPEGIDRLEQLVDVLRNRFAKVELGASRPLVDSGLLPRSRQIGQTGERVTPELYFAVGISGSTQHISGITGSKKIIAINKNRDAPIFEIADYGIVAAFEDILPSLKSQLEELE